MSAAIKELRELIREKPAVKSVGVVFLVYFSNAFAEAIGAGVIWSAVGTTIVCDVAQNPSEEWSGSFHCGDKTKILEDSVKLLLTAGGTESMISMAWFFIDVVLIECVHRKKLLYGILVNDFFCQGFMTLFCFNMLGRWNVSAFYFVSCIHAISPTQVLIDTVFLDLTEGDIHLRKRGYMMKEVISAVTGFLAPITVVAILYMKLTDYTMVYASLVCLQVVCMVILFSVDIECAALRPKSQLRLRSVVDKFLEAVRLLRDPTVQFPALVKVLNGSMGFAFHVSSHVLMNHLHWRQEAVGWISIVNGFITMPLGFLQWTLAEKFGERRYLGWMFVSESICSYSTAPLLPTSSAGFITNLFAYFANVSLLHSLKQTAESLMPHYREEIRCEVTLLFKALGSAGGVISSFSMGRLIGYKAGGGYLEQAIPFIPSIILRVIRDIVQYYWMWPRTAIACDIITENRLKREREEQKKEDGKTVGEKKED